MFKMKKYEDRLMTALDFSEFDLENNRVGLMTHRQAQRLRTARMFATLSWSIPVVLGTGGLILWIMVVLSIENSPADAILVPVVIGLLSGGWLYAYYGQRVSRLNDDLEENRAAAVEGRIDLSLVMGNHSASYSLRVDKIRFPLRQRAFLAFKNGDPYRIYYTPNSRHILSVEWLRDQEDDDPFEPLTLTDADEQPEKRKAA